MFDKFLKLIEKIPEKKKKKNNFPGGVTSVTSVTRGVNYMKNNKTACHVCVTFVTVLGVFLHFHIYIACGNRFQVMLKKG